jgi:hypothetical protein
VKEFNRKVRKQMIFNHAIMINVDLNREHFTRHGLYMNASGKERRAKRISYVIRAVLTRKTEEPIILTWKGKLMDGNQEENKGKRKVTRDIRNRTAVIRKTLKAASDKT